MNRHLKICLDFERFLKFPYQNDFPFCVCVCVFKNMFCQHTVHHKKVKKGTNRKKAKNNMTFRPNGR